jgi:pimeloyl-ACP methyl ester carboxylesterase
MEGASVTLMTKSVELSTRVKLPYVEQGDPAGVPVLLLHGVSDSWRSFAPVLPHLPGAIRAFALSQRGHGDADRPATGYRTRDFAADVAAFMDALGLEQAIVVGHSMGTTNALRFAIDHPGRTLGLVLTGTFATYRGNPDIVELWEAAVSRFTDPIDREFVREFQQSTLAQPVPEAFFDAVVQESLKVPAHVWRAAFAGFLEDDFVAELSEIEAPALILWGARDALCPRADQEALLTAIAEALLVVYAGAGHAPHWEEPKRFAADLTAFVERLVGRQSGARRGAATAGSDRDRRPRRSRAHP